LDKLKNRKTLDTEQIFGFPWIDPLSPKACKILQPFGSWTIVNLTRETENFEMGPPFFDLAFGFGPKQHRFVNGSFPRFLKSEALRSQPSGNLAKKIEIPKL